MGPVPFFAVAPSRSSKRQRNHFHASPLEGPERGRRTCRSRPIATAGNVLIRAGTQARDEDKPDYADELTTLASGTFDRANEMELRSGAIPLPPVTEVPQPTAQQQQQLQPKKKKD